uniref:Complex I assembly factor TIMMDC1, mitochondrial n=1 Tax=Parastrongyloides trichosuri TaxID=131310 RepID=A0A0N4Z0L1_PARTI
MSDTPTVKILTDSERIQRIPSTGFERIKSIYDGFSDGKISFEIDLVGKVCKYSFLTAFLLGGLTGYQGAAERYNMHSTGKTFLSPRDAIKRKFDFSIAMFVKRGFIHGLRATALAGSVVYFTTHLAAYQNKYSYFYFPLVSGATTGVLHAGTVFGVLAFPLGVLGSFKAIGLGLITGGTLSAATAIYGLSVNKSASDVYKQFKMEYEEVLRLQNEEEIKIRKFMKDEGIYFKPMAIKKLREIENEKMFKEISSQDDS